MYWSLEIQENANISSQNSNLKGHISTELVLKMLGHM